MEWANSDREKILEHLECIVAFLERYQRLWRAHVVEFFQERMWEILDPEWLDALQNASVEELVLLPSYNVKECWPATLKKFLEEAKSLAVPRNQDQAFVDSTAIVKVVSDGMNAKKLHEIGLLSSLIANISAAVNATEVIDVGAGQGYLAQVLAFQYSLPVVALDCCAHNSSVTSKRAERIQKYYAARTDKVLGPKAMTCHIGSDTQTSLDSLLASLDDRASCKNSSQRRSVVLAGLHACGDLSANMLRTFVQCTDVMAVVSVGCCYNLLSEPVQDDKLCGFPMSKGMRNLNLFLGGAGRDLGCQSAERWKDIKESVAQANFEIHAFRAALQVILQRFYPSQKSPSVGRLGKAKRRKHSQRLQTGVQRTPDDVFSGFRHYTTAALSRLELPDIPTEQLLELWNEVQPFVKFIGPFWSLRAAVAPVIETLLLLDRLLYLKEEEVDGSSSMLVPVFDPQLSPRNMAIIATRKAEFVQLSFSP